MQTAAEIIANYKSIQAKPWHYKSTPPAPRIVPVEDHTPKVQPITITYTIPKVIYYPHHETPWPKKNSVAKVRHIARVVAAFYRISLQDILSDRRTADFVRARHVAFFLAKELTSRSYPEIGRQLGGRDHTTVLHGVRRITNLVLTAEVRKLREMLEGSL
jgi:chromosomal replication initiation ATPase DnaA